MNSVVVHYKELALKGKNRPWFIQLLMHNLRAALADLGVLTVRSVMGRIEIELSDDTKWTDIRERILPDKVNFLGLGLGLALSLFTAPIDGIAEWLSRRMFAFPPPPAALSFGDALLGAAAASGLLWLVA